MDVFQLLGAEAVAFDFDNPDESEKTVLQPALEKRGYKDVQFYDEQGDSMNPRVRGILTTAPSGAVHKFHYFGKCTIRYGSDDVKVTVIDQKKPSFIERLFSFFSMS